MPPSVMIRCYSVAQINNIHTNLEMCHNISCVDRNAVKLKVCSLPFLQILLKKKKMESQKKWTLKMAEGVDMEISHQPPKMRNVVNLIIAMERLKASVSETLLSTEFRDEQLFNLMLESVVEGDFPKQPSLKEY